MIFWSLLIIVSCGFYLGESDGEWNSSFLLVCTVGLVDTHAEMHAMF
jgi:hypothetical protein